MPKIPDCARCTLYAHNPHLVCAVHPDDVETDKCLDFRHDLNAHIEEQWSPSGYSWYDNVGDIIARSHYRKNQTTSQKTKVRIFSDSC